MVSKIWLAPLKDFGRGRDRSQHTAPLTTRPTLLFLTLPWHIASLYISTTNETKVYRQQPLSLHKLWETQRVGLYNTPNSKRDSAFRHIVNAIAKCTPDIWHSLNLSDFGTATTTFEIKTGAYNIT